MEVVERDDGVVELRPHVAVPADQAWYWTPEWQERAAEEDLAAARFERFMSGEELLRRLRGLSSDADL